jgi:hypothetical protein
MCTGTQVYFFAALAFFFVAGLYSLAGRTIHSAELFGSVAAFVAFPLVFAFIWSRSKKPQDRRAMAKGFFWLSFGYFLLAVFVSTIRFGTIFRALH